MFVEQLFLFYVCRANSLIMKLSQAEERLMRYLWKLQKAYMKDLIQSYDDPKPATTTIATLLKRMIQKEMVAYETFGKNRLYTPLVTKSAYFNNKMKTLITDFFGNSKTQFASYFTESSDFTKTELEELKALIEVQIKKKEKK